LEKLAGTGVLYHGLEIMGGGSILGGLILGAIAVFVIDRRFNEAAYFTFAGAALTYFGFMHGEAIGVGFGLGVTPTVTFAYLLVGAFLLGCARYSQVQPVRDYEPEHGHGHELAAQPAE
jgi:AGZA family xanthine/uracil permease-like MFS transporter